jgi:hypothetical protein
MEVIKIVNGDAVQIHIHFIPSGHPKRGFSLCRISSVDGTDEFFEGETIVRAR